MVLDRILGSLRDIIREELGGRSARAGVPAGAVFAPWEYTVSEATDAAVTARRADSSCPWPDVVQIPIYPGIAGARYRPAVGSVVGVAFANGDPSKPRIVWADQTVPWALVVDAQPNPSPAVDEVHGYVSIGQSADAVKLALGPNDTGPAIHRVGDAGTAGSISVQNTVMPAPPGVIITWTMPSAAVYVLTITGAISAALVGPTTSIEVDTEATSGSSKGTCG